MNRVHDLKCWPEPFRAVVAGTKRHEFRFDDRGYAVGDVLYLYEWDPTPSSLGVKGHTQFYTVVRVTYVGRGFGIPDRHVAMSIVPAQEGPDWHYVSSNMTFIPAAALDKPKETP
jgi:hypothetical protein